MSDTGSAVIAEDMVLKGEIRNGRLVEVKGYVEGSIASERLVVHPGGRVYGTVKAGTAEVHGALQGKVSVRQLISIGQTGSVHGEVHYGKLAMAAGGELSAEVRNVPPELAGDLRLTVRRGRSVAITADHLTAVDPDDPPETLFYAVTRPSNGFVARSDAPGMPLQRFTQADILAGRMLFVHDNAAAPECGFDVVVTDHAGATSGAAQHVTVVVY
jgi:cytoskeletal protein CcmA (bactofilin family)